MTGLSGLTRAPPGCRDNGLATANSAFVSAEACVIYGKHITQADIDGDRSAGHLEE